MNIISICWNMTRNLEMKPVFLRWHLDMQFFLNKWPDLFFLAIQKKGESGGLIYSKATKVTIWVFHSIYTGYHEFDTNGCNYFSFYEEIKDWSSHPKMKE